MKQGEVLELDIPSSPEYVAIVRGAVESIAHKMQFTEIEVDDLKLAVGEACTNAVRHGCPNGKSPQVQVRCTILGDGLQVEIRNDIEACEYPRIPLKPDTTKEGGFGLYMIGKLVDEFDLVWDRKTAAIRMLKRFGTAAVKG